MLKRKNKLEKPTNPAKLSWKNVKRFLQGWRRYILFRLSGTKLIPEMNLLEPHLQEQFQYRLQVMNPECLKRGECVICGCETPQLQLADDSCEGNCYPPFMEKQGWEEIKRKDWNALPKALGMRRVGVSHCSLQCLQCSHRACSSCPSRGRYT